MKFQILNNEELGFFDNNGNKKAIMKLSGSNFIIDPVDTGANIIMGEGETINDLELGIASTPINMTFLGGGTISSNAGTLYIGDGINDDKVVLTGVTIGSSVNFSAGLTGSFQGSFTGDGSNITGITATTAPGGNNKTIQFNDNSTATGGNNNFTFDKTTNVVELTGSINVSGSSSADYFFGDGSGLTNIVGAFPFTGSAGVSGSIEVQGPVTASAFTGDGSGLTNVAGVFPFTGSAGISGSLDVNGNVTATAFYGNGANITGVTSTFAPTGQDKSLQFNKGGTEISGSGGILFDYNTDSLYVAQAITASEFTGHGSLNDPFIGDTEITGSVKIKGSLNAIGAITASVLRVANNIKITGSATDGGGNETIMIGGNGSTVPVRTIGIGQVANLNAYDRVAIGPRSVGGGAQSVVIGDSAASNNTSGAIIAIGQTANRFCSGVGSVAIGTSAMYNDGALGNAGSIAIGDAAGFQQNGPYNILIGNSSGRSLTGEYNTVLGYQAGYNLTGSKNVVLGYQAGYNLTGSNQLIIANNSSSALITGDFDTGAVEFLGNSFKVGTNRPAGPVFEVGDGPLSGYTTDLILRPRANSAYNFHYWGIIRWDPSGTNRGLRLLSGDYTNSVQIGTGLSGSATENIIANFTNSGVRIGDRSTPNADLDVNGTAIVSGSLEIKDTTAETGATTFEVKNSNGNAFFRVKDDGHVGIGLGSNGTFSINDNGGDRIINVTNYDIVDSIYNFNITAGGTAINTNSDTQNVTINQVKFQRGSGVNTNTPNTQAWEIVMPTNAGHIKNYNVIRGNDYGLGQGSEGGPQMNIFAGSGSAGFGDLVLQHDFDQSRGNVGIGKEPNYTLDIQSGTSSNLRLGSSTTNQGEHKIGFGFHDGDNAMGVAIIGKAGGSSGKGSLSFAAHSGGDNNSASYDDRALEINSNHVITYKPVRATDDVFTIGGSNTGDVGLFLHQETRTAIVSKLLGSSNTSDIRLVTGIPKNGGIVSASADQYARLTITQDGNTEISGSLEVNGSNVDFSNLPTSNPGVAGRLYQTGSEAIGATAGFQVVLISEG
jgi:hypothetical protein